MKIPNNLLCFSREHHEPWNTLSQADLRYAKALFIIIQRGGTMCDTQNLERWLRSKLEDTDFGEKGVIQLLQIVSSLK